MAQPVVDFTTGLTDPTSLPVEELAEAASEAVRDMGEGLALYPGAFGHAGLRRVLAARESRREGIEVDPDRIALTNGSMQAVTLLGRVLMERPGDVILTEELTYSGTLSAYRGLGARLVGVPLDDEGMRVDRLEEILDRLEREGTPPRFLYTLPTFHNPTGTVMPLERRRRLLDVARRHRLVVVEDNCYGDVHFEGEVPPALYALDDGPNVVYIGSLSKILAAGLRIGYLMARPPLLERLLEQRFDCGHSLLSAGIAARFLERRLWEHVARHNEALRRKRDALVAALDRHVARFCTWRVPGGGLFLWLGLPHDCDLDRLERVSTERGLLFGRGSSYHVEGREIPALRLAFGHLSAEEIEGGVGRLADCLREVVGERSAAPPVVATGAKEG